MQNDQNYSNRVPPEPSGRYISSKNLIRLVLAGVSLILIVFIIYFNYVGQDNYLEATQLRNQFLDLDEDGDLDYLIYGEVIINCAGGGCLEYCADGSCFGEISPEATLPPPPTPQVYSEETDPN